MNLYYIIVGIDNGKIPYISKFTLTEIISNTGKHKDTEMFYALQELHASEIEWAFAYRPILVKTNRDNEVCIGLLTRVDKQRYDETVESFE